MKQSVWLTKYCPSLKGKTVAVTGATGGLGREICRGVLFLGGSLLLLNRDRRKTAALQAALLQEFPGAVISFHCLDLTDLSSVNAVCEVLRQDIPDILLHNAGIYDVPRVTCSTGLLNVFQVNFAAPYYLTKQLLPEIRSHGCRVTVVGSIAHTYSETDPTDPDFHLRSACHLVYGNSKRYLMFAFQALARQEQLDVSIGHPGLTLTGISNHYPAWLYPIIRPCLRYFFMKPETASRGILYAMTHPLPLGTWAGPRYFHLWGNPDVQTLSSCREPEQQTIFSSAEDIYDSMAGIN